MAAIPQPQRLSPVQIVLLLLVLGAAAGGAFFLWQRHSSEQEAAAYVAEIGEHKITPVQLKLREQHANVYYPGSGTPEVALAQLIQGYLAAELMKQQGVTLDQATWLAEEERINRQTRDPATLAKVQYVYGQDHDNYLYVGILPDFAQSRIFKLYRSSSSFAESARKKASGFLDTVSVNPERFAAEAQQQGLAVRRLLVDARRGLLPADGSGSEAQGMQNTQAASPQESQLRAEMKAQAGEQEIEAARNLLAKLGSLAPGQVYQNTLESPESFEAVRLVARRADGVATVEMVSFAKPDFGHWFWGEAAKIPVRINNPALKAQFVREVSWAKQLNLY